MSLEATDIICSHCGRLFVVECEVDNSDKPDHQMIECPAVGCGQSNHRTLNGFQVNWFVVSDQIAAIRRWQTDPAAHHLTCGNDSGHSLLRPSLESEGQLVLLCPDCDYRQVDIPAIVLRTN